MMLKLGGFVTFFRHYKLHGFCMSRSRCRLRSPGMHRVEDQVDAEMSFHLLIVETY